MRAKAADDELLEPLPVLVDGRAVAPVPAAHDFSVRDVLPTAQEVVDAVLATIADAEAVRALAPWSYGDPGVPRARVSGARASFLRMIALHPARLEAVPEWWRHRARDGQVVVARRLALEEPRRRACDTWCMRGHLRSPRGARWISVEVALWPHLGYWTKLGVEPQRGVHAGRRYFTSGHRVLDVLTHRLIREL